MKIIDAHMHFSKAIPSFAPMAERVGHLYTEEHLQAEFARLNIERAVVMGNGSIRPECHQYPDFLRYCIGLDNKVMEALPDAHILDLLEQNLQRESCVGIKLYPGYNHVYVGDARFFPLYELAAQYDKPVAIHTGSTANGMGFLKYCHPLTVDEAATQFPKTRFVMCHFGNPWLPDAAAVLEKNANVFADLSGLLEGLFDLDELFEENRGYFSLLRTWLGYAGGYEKVMYGTDWPLVNMEQYIHFMQCLIPEKHHEKVFYQTAKHVYHL